MMKNQNDLRPERGWRKTLYEVIFESDTPAGKIFDLVLIWSIVLSVLTVMLESVARIRSEHGNLLIAVEWAFTLLFTIEYFLRLVSVRRSGQYAKSFFGVIDLLAIMPTYVSLLIPGAQSLLVIRAFRLLRIFRVLKLGEYLREANVLYEALRMGRPKIVVFLIGVGATVTTSGAVLYLVEGPENGFTSIPIGIYWAIVTMATVGFGDIAPKTPLGQFFASILIIVGYGVIAVPTGIVTTELVRASSVEPAGSPKGGSGLDPAYCDQCGLRGHSRDARYCRRCGAKLVEKTTSPHP